jgi:hypothetical protein
MIPPGPPQNQPPSLWGKLVLIGVTLAAFGLGAIWAFVVGMPGGGNQQVAAQPEPPVAQSPAPQNTPQPPVKAAAEQDLTAPNVEAKQTAKQAPTTRITLQEVPEGATVRVNGRDVGGSLISLPSGPYQVRIDVSLAGYRPWRREVSAAQDATIQVGLLPYGRRGAAPSRSEEIPEPEPSERPPAVPGLPSSTFGAMPSTRSSDAPDTTRTNSAVPAEKRSNGSSSSNNFGEIP